MAFLDTTFNVDELPESEPDFKPIPAGWYNASITSAELKATSKGGQRISVRYDVTGPSHQGRVVFGNFNVRNNSEEAVRISREQLGQLMRATGLGKLENTDQLIGLQTQIKVKVKPADGEFDANNEVIGFKALEGSTIPTNTGAAAQTNTGEKKAPWER